MSRFLPGPGNGEGTPPGEWRACGRCEGVVYFRDLEQFGDTGKSVVLTPGNERQALRYLLGPDTDCAGLPPAVAARAQEARDFCRGNPSRLGITYPHSLSRILALIPASERAAAANGREITAAFTCCAAGKTPARQRWTVTAVEPGIWALTLE